MTENKVVRTESSTNVGEKKKSRLRPALSYGPSEGTANYNLVGNNAGISTATCGVYFISLGSLNSVNIEWGWSNLSGTTPTVITGTPDPNTPITGMALPLFESVALIGSNYTKDYYISLDPQGTIQITFFPRLPLFPLATSLTLISYYIGFPYFNLLTKFL